MEINISKGWRNLTMEYKSDRISLVKHEVLSIRVNEELKLALQEVARKEYLSVSRVVFRALMKVYPELTDIITKN